MLIRLNVFCVRVSCENCYNIFETIKSLGQIPNQSFMSGSCKTVQIWSRIYRTANNVSTRAWPVSSWISQPNLFFVELGGFPLLLYCILPVKKPTAREQCALRSPGSRWQLGCISAALVHNKLSVWLIQYCTYITHHKYNNRSHLVIFLHMADQLQSTKW